MDTRREKLETLKKEKNAVIMAHYYVPDEVQEIADYIGDSYYLSDMATKVDASVIVLCGVRFMGESAKILNPETSDCFTIQQLVAIAQALHVSTDFILGIKTEEIQPEEAEITLADVCTKLFELDELAPLSFGVCENGEFEVPDSFTGIPLELQSPCIFFKNQSITDFIAEWNEIKKLNVQNSALKNNVYSTWKSGSITENKSKLKKYNFKEKRFFQKILAESFLSDYSSSSYENWPILLPDDADLLKEYIESGNYTLDLDSQDQSILLDWFKKIGHSSI